MGLPSLKRRKPIVYISLGLYIALSAFIIVESCIEGGLSRIQSDFMAMISAWFVNNTTEPTTPIVLDPVSIGTISDSTYTGQAEDGYSNIVVGTTTLVTIPFNYPDKGKDFATYNYTYTLDYVSGDKNNYGISLGTRTSGKTLNVDMRITPTEITDDIYQINVNVAELTYEYKFHIVDLLAPSSFEYKVDKTTLKIGETTKIRTKLTGKDKKDIDLRRYYDENKIYRSSSDESVASIDKHGVIHALSTGVATITYGENTFDVTVNTEHIVKPSSNSINLEISELSKNNPSLLDYDYLFNTTDDIDNYTTTIYVSYSDLSLEDQNVSWDISDHLKGKLVPYSYDEEGYPVYKDENGKECIRIAGYRKKGDLEITCISDVDASINKSISLVVDEAIPTEMNVIIGKTSIYVNEQKVITATFGPKNVNNKKIHVELSDIELATLNTNDATSIVLTAQKEGNLHITITSVANPELRQEFDLSFTMKPAIDDDNFAEFAAYMRKALGHFLLFLFTAIAGTTFFISYFADEKLVWVQAFVSYIFGFITAGISEIIQYYVPSRGGVMSDVGIDSLGYLLGVLFIVGVYYLIKLIKYLIRRAKSKNNS